ncbi:MAG: hypothetical protein VZR00_01150 [Lachnospiraceae bacterium]|nr:hypothetical protein [Lachnospiraceae bacterium]
MRSSKYHFDYKGVRADFTVSEAITGDELKAGLNGLSWSTKEVDGGAMSYEVHATLTGCFVILSEDVMIC